MMNSIVSVVTALMMLFNIFGAFTGNLESPVSFTISAQVDAAAAEKAVSLIPASQDVPSLSQGVSVVADVLNTLSVRGAADPSGADLEIGTQETPVVTLGFRKDDAGIKATSSLLGGSLITMNPETVNEQTGMMGDSLAQASAMQAALKALDQQKALADVHQAVDNAVAKIAEKAGPFEAGEFFLEEEFSFTKKAVLDISYQELMGVILNEAETVLSSGEYAEVFAAMEESANPIPRIQSLKEAMANLDPSRAYETAAALYENEEGERMVVADLHRAANPEQGLADANDMHLYFGTEFRNARLGITVTRNEDAPSQVSLSFAEDGAMTLIASLQAGEGRSVFINAVRDGQGCTSAVFGVWMGETFIRVLADMKADETDTHTVDLQLLIDGADGETLYPLKTSAVWTPGSELAPIAAAEGAETVAMEALMGSEEEAQTAQSSLQASLMIGASSALFKLLQVLPAETASFLQQALFAQ